jgi:hypothetical protein
MRTLMGVRGVLGLVVSFVVGWAVLGYAANVGVTPTKLIVVDKTSAASKAKVVFVAKDPAIAKGAGENAGDIEASFAMTYDSTSGAFDMPLGGNWLVNKSTVAKYVNKEAPLGGSVKVSVIKPAKVVKMVAKSLGDTPIDILGTGVPSGNVYTAYCVTNGGDETCMCSSFSGCAYKKIAADSGAKLVCKNGTGDGACTAVAVPTTTTTTFPPVTPFCGDGHSGSCPSDEPCNDYGTGYRCVDANINTFAGIYISDPTCGDACNSLQVCLDGSFCGASGFYACGAPQLCDCVSGTGCTSGTCGAIDGAPGFCGCF